ncbi:ROK family protein [Jatrophihabitans telluris]|uniref:ROK family protein n=1 Tax=Jatrophihabitans telluris TaxID=2038343 RepID=A0ABY4R337_9ACTN|nr:ROK family protein [Jatrophihabitans telluris]UQX89833.1 ROK family protein [Jatrophihabitans telluris]
MYIDKAEQPGPAVTAIDLGGTAMKGSVWDRAGRELLRRDRPTPVAAGVLAIVAAVVDLHHELVSALHEQDPELSVQALGLICPGLVDPRGGIALYSANLGWRDLPLRELVSAALAMPVSLDHDVRSAGRAEAEFGAARGVSEALYVQIGTGIAATLIIGGEVLVGSRGRTGEIGHVPARPDGEPCACGQRGCTETYASAAAIARRYRSRTREPAGLGVEIDAGIDAEVVIARAAAGDDAARQVFDEAIQALAIALAGYTMLADPELIVLGGGLSRAGALLIDPLAAELTARLTWREPPRITIGAFAADAGRRGAAQAALRLLSPAWQ